MTFDEQDQLEQYLSYLEEGGAFRDTPALEDAGESITVSLEFPH